jgi:AhpD family alkylhydroperoxidase
MLFRFLVGSRRGDTTGKEETPMRVDYRKVFPEGVRAMAELERTVRSATLEPELLELVRIKASQINGCTYCLAMHNRDARARGEHQTWLNTLAAWRAAPYYTAREPRGPPLVAVQQTRDLLPERLHRAVQGRAPQPPHPDLQHDRPPIRGHVRHRPLAVSVHMAGQAAAPRARHRPARRPRPDHDHLILVRHILDDQGGQPREHNSHEITYLTQPTMPRK